MPRGRPHASWLHQVEAYLKDMDMTGLASVCGRWPNGDLSEGYGHDGPGILLCRGSNIRVKVIGRYPYQ